MKNLDKLFNPKSIAVVGASPNKKKLGNILTQNILAGGWKGKLYFVNPKYSKIRKDYFANLREIKKPIDLVLVAIPAPFVNQVLIEGAESNPKIENYAVISAGFKESGKEGKELEEELKKTAETRKLNILGPNCLGFINTSKKLNATFTSGKYKTGKVAVVSQSGALAVALLDWAEEMSIGFSKVVSIGNKAALDESDALNFLFRDPETTAVALYLEDIKDGKKFVEAADKISRNKPLVVIKAGKNRAGQKAISSHTGSLAQDSDVLEAVFEKLNVIEAKTVEEFQNLILLMNFSNSLERSEVIIITNAGGPGVLASDFVGNSKYLKLLKIPPRTKEKLKKFLPKSASLENPIDIIGDATPDRYKSTLDVVSRDLPKNPAVIILTPQTQTDSESVSRIIKDYKKKLPAVATVFMGGGKIKKAVENLHQNGIANFENPEEALATIEKLVIYSSKKRTGLSQMRQKDIHLKLGVNSAIQSALKEKRKMLFWKEAERIFRSYGVELAKSVDFSDLREIKSQKIPFPCVLKTDDPKIIHRWDKKAVILNIQSEKELKAAFRTIKKSTGARRFLLQETAKPGLEMIVGLKRDRDFGPVIILGRGGTLTEIFRDRIIFIPPLSAKEIKSKLSGLKMYPVLKGFRGEKGYDLEEIAKIILALQEIAAENPDIGKIDINPAILYNNSAKCRIIDAKIYLS